MSISTGPEAAPQWLDVAKLGYVRTHGKPLSVIACLGVLAIAVALGLRWWTHPNVFGELGGDGNFVTYPRPVQKSTMTFAVVVPRESGTPTTVTFRSAPVLNFATNTAHAKATFGICYPVRDSNGTIEMIANVEGSGQAFCSRIDPIVAGTAYRFEGGGAAPYIIATSTPTTPGKVVMTGADFDYVAGSSAWSRRGVDHVEFRNVQRVVAPRG